MDKMMKWKKLLDTKDLIAYEKKGAEIKVRIEARQKKNAWSVYKTYNFLKGEEWTSHVREYVTRSREETDHLLTELRKEKDLSPQTLTDTESINLELKRCYKEEFVEKWKFRMDKFTDDNFIVIRYDSEIRVDVVMHDRYNHLEKEIFNRLVDALGLQDMAEKIRYEFFYFKKHSSKRRTYMRKEEPDVVAQVEFNFDQYGGN